MLRDGQITESYKASVSHADPGRGLKKPARAPDADAGRLEPHVCRHCFGRLFSRLLAAGQPDVRRWECSNCGAVADGPSSSALCACGVVKQAGPGVKLLQCAPNPNPTADFPSLFVAVPAAT